MNLKTRLLAGASALTLVGGIAVAAAPSAMAAPIGACTGGQQLAGIKTPDGLGLNNTLKVVKIGIKSNLSNAMTCSGAPAAAGPVDAGTFKATLGNGTTSEASCDTTLVSTALPPAGKVGWTQQTGVVVNQGYIRLSATDPTKNYYSDVVGVHGIMTKGPLAGVDVDATVWQNPTVKDKTLPVAGSWVGVDTNAQDSFLIGASCQTGGSAGDLSFNNGLGGVKGPVAAPTNVTLTLVGDGLSFIDPILPLVSPTPGKLGACPCVAASGLLFSVS